MFESPNTLGCDLALVGWDRFRRAWRGLTSHRHYRAWEICFIVRGYVEWWAGGEIYRLHGGDLFITQPGESHGGVNAMIHPCELLWIQVRAPQSGRFDEMSRRDSVSIRQGLLKLPLRTFPAGEQVPAMMRRLLDLHRDYKGPFGRLHARALLHQILATIVEQGNEASLRERPTSEMAPTVLADARRILATDLDHSLRVWEVAQQYGLRPARFHQIFLQHHGMSPAKFRTQCRITLAKQRLMGSTASLTQIALECGLGNSQYFSTVFKRWVGLTPSEFRGQSRRAKSG